MKFQSRWSPQRSGLESGSKIRELPSGARRQQAIPKDETEFPMSQLTRITDDDFDIKVIVAGRPVVVFFTAKWSSPVKAGNQVLDELQTEYADKALFF